MKSVECIPWEEIRDRFYGNANAKDKFVKL